jgi:hypothetical protein
MLRKLILIDMLMFFMALTADWLFVQIILPKKKGTLLYIELPLAKEFLFSVCEWIGETRLPCLNC